MKFETLEDLEKKLSALSIKQADKSYQLKNQLLIQELKELNKPFNWLYALAFSLVLSLMVNIYQFMQPKSEEINNNLAVQNNNAQNLSGGYSLIQGGLVPYSGHVDTALLRRKIQ